MHPSLLQIILCLLFVSSVYPIKIICSCCHRDINRRELDRVEAPCCRVALFTRFLHRRALVVLVSGRCPLVN
ncbi:hypothetical protein BGY98DRAFT_959621 [Russula aff. rugulosa BPL654]|nr:hypothetical protein BGY98DRAFT_959621 [Russula aff. rugulosa BPL654]